VNTPFSALHAGVATPLRVSMPVDTLYSELQTWFVKFLAVAFGALLATVWIGYCLSRLLSSGDKHKHDSTSR